MLSWLSRLLKDPESREALLWLGSGMAAVTGGLWTAFAYFVEHQNDRFVEHQNDRIAQNLSIVLAFFFWVYLLTYFFVFRAHLGRLRKVIDTASSGAATPTQAEADAASDTIDTTHRRAQLASIAAGLLILFSVGFHFLRSLPEYVEIIPDAFVQRAIVLGLFASSVAIMGCVLWVENKISRAKFVLVARSKIIASIPEDHVPDYSLLGERDENRYRKNLSSTFKIKFFELHSASIFRDVAWDLEPGVNVLLGRNGYGKSYLLRLLAGMVIYDNDRFGKLLSNSDDDPQLAAYLLRNGDPVTITRGRSRFFESVGKVPLLAIPDSRFVNRTQRGVGNPGNDYADLARNGAYHFLYELPYDTTIQTVLFEMCIDAWGRGNWGRGKHPDQPVSPQLDLVCNVVRELSGEEFRFSLIEPIGQGLFSIQITMDSSLGRPISLQRASQGTLSIVAICLLIYQFLRAVHRSAAERDLCNQPGIVIIDEIDAHLHPAWQRKIVYLLRKHFPNVQFLLTAHSPLVVAGCGSGEVAVLRRDDNSGLKVVDFQMDFVGASLTDIYRNLFEIEELDVKFLELQADLPLLPGLYDKLQSLMKEAKPDQKRIREVGEEIRAIARTREKQKTTLNYQALEEENAKLRRQLAELQKREGRGDT